jgi:hypothetical protein
MTVVARPFVEEETRRTSLAVFDGRAAVCACLGHVVFPETVKTPCTHRTTRFRGAVDGEP